jgi:hypothetical protein
VSFCPHCPQFECWLQPRNIPFKNVLYAKTRPLILTCGHTGLNLVGKWYEFQAFIFELLVPKTRPFNIVRTMRMLIILGQQAGMKCRLPVWWSHFRVVLYGCGFVTKTFIRVLGSTSYLTKWYGMNSYDVFIYTIPKFRLDSYSSGPVVRSKKKGKKKTSNNWIFLHDSYTLHYRLRYIESLFYGFPTRYKGQKYVGACTDNYKALHAGGWSGEDVIYFSYKNAYPMVPVLLLPAGNHG